jgi:hypothetical protein
MKLQTQIPIQKSHHSIDYDSEVLLLGSCFSENMGNQLAYYKFKTLQNPFGILYTPLAIEKCLAAALGKREISENHLLAHNEKWQWLDVHSDLTRKTKVEAQKALERSLATTKVYLQNASHVFLTLGTAWAYKYKATNEFVANCHKIPKKEFEKVLIPQEELVASLENTLEMIYDLNPSIEISITISPVRHLKDGFVENQRSKAHLIAAVHQVIEKSKAYYFPAYEIMMDELRDYRFYGKDMVHPNTLAIDYIWERFSEVYISDKAKKSMEAIETIQKGLEHRPFDESSNAHQKFLKSLRQKIAYIKEEYPFMDFN